jgi:hypothetical protein
MQNSREDSVWRTLAVAFGDGLASRVGMNLTQNAVRPAAENARPELRPLAVRLSAIEHRIERARASGALPAPATVDAHVTELTTRMERGLAELEVKVKIQMEALHQRDCALDEEFGEQISALRSQMVTLHKEFAETVSRLVEDQIEEGVAARMEPLEEKLREAIREEAGRAAAVVSAELERRLEDRDRSLLEMVLALGKTCLETAGRMQPPDLTLPSFARVEPPRGEWRVPLVSSFFAVTCALLLLHYL